MPLKDPNSGPLLLIWDGMNAGSKLTLRVWSILILHFLLKIVQIGSVGSRADALQEAEETLQQQRLLKGAQDI